MRHDLENLITALTQTASVYGGDTAIKMLQNAFYAESAGKSTRDLHDSECMFLSLVQGLVTRDGK